MQATTLFGPVFPIDLMHLHRTKVRPRWLRVFAFFPTIACPLALAWGTRACHSKSDRHGQAKYDGDRDAWGHSASVILSPIRAP